MSSLEPKQNSKSPEKSESFFPELSGDNPENGSVQVESLCLSCNENGETRLLLTKIPYFKEVIISSFTCEFCGHTNNHVQPSGRIENKGCEYTLTINSKKDLNRQMIKSDYATMFLPELEFEHPANKRGEINTIEGILSSIVDNLESSLPVQKALDPENGSKIETFVKDLKLLFKVEQSFQLVLDDPSGNSFIENFNAPKKDEQLKTRFYTRTSQQNSLLGLEDNKTTDSSEYKSNLEKKIEDIKLTDEVISFQTNCASCNKPCPTNMKLVDIPFFKQVVIMATACDHCGAKENEVKTAAGIEERGTRITIKLTSKDDLSRDILKSDTCGLEIPELEFDLSHGSLGGKFTTIEGILVNIKENLCSNNPFFHGDSSIPDINEKLNAFKEKLNKIISGEWLGVHLIIDDPAGNSYLQNPFAPEDDPEMKIEKYIRSFEQNEMLGLNDMKTENYGENS